MKTRIFFLLFFPISALLSQEQSIQKKIEALTETFMKEHSITSIAVIVIGQEGDEPFEQMITRGTLAERSLIPVNRDSTFRIGPLTQLFTAFALASLVQEGRVNLSDPVSKFLPKSVRIPHYQGKEITLEDLATHTAALPNLPDLCLHFSPFRVSQMYRLLSKYELPREPGMEYEFSNLGYAFLTHLLSCISKKQFPLFLNQLLSEQLGLKEALFIPNPKQKCQLVTGYHFSKEVWTLFREKTYSILMGSEGLYSTPCDLFSFLFANLLAKKSSSLGEIFSIMQTPYRTFSTFQMGLGWKITPFTPLKQMLYSVGGNFLGFGTYMGFIPETKTGVVILYNQQGIEPALFAERLLNLIHPASLK